ncbi:DNA-directed DNA polymerase gamma mip1 [Borealophlyctis nickersoniae]|nr:DNA-directed DNA polymerase gamma mip1 [Borealophlyctis nickersoniae]
MLSKGIHEKVFPHADPERKATQFHINLARIHLENNDLLGKTQDPMPEIDLELPEMVGKDVKEHFRILGLEQSEPYLSQANKLVNMTLPPIPDVWKHVEGWCQYHPDGSWKSVLFPGEDILIFDTEVMYKISPYPVLAVAASETSWYSWVSPGLFGDEKEFVPHSLVPFGHPDKERLIVGHHVAYDRARILEEYRLQPTKYAFVDTMSLHSAVGGLSSQQRPAWLKIQKYREERKKKRVDEGDDVDFDMEEDDLVRGYDPAWVNVSSMNALPYVARLYLGEEVDKSTRLEFEGRSAANVREKFQELIKYCAEDVRITHDLFKVVFPKFLEKCPHPASFAGMLHMGKSYLTTSTDWQKFIEAADAKCSEHEKRIEEILGGLVNKALEEGAEKAESDPWLRRLDWTTSAAKMTKQVLGKDGKVLKSARPYKSRSGTPVDKPKWYRDLWDSGEQRIRITTSMRPSPYLLKLRWKGYPVCHTKKFGWTFVVPKAEADQQSSEPLQFSPEVGQPTYDPVISNDTENVYFRIPHSAGEGKNCGNPLGKSYIGAFEGGTLTSEYPEAKEILDRSAECTYWIGSRDRVKSQFVLYDKSTVGNVEGSNGKSVGVILPQSVVMGTITRRAVEATWMTASNAKKKRIGSELKSLIQAPKGYKFVGADVDSEELWIASLLGDSQFGLHGATAIGFMTLQGSKSAGTDLHTVTGNIVGISRDHAKVFNYSRIYGAGVHHAVQLLVQYNPGLDRSVALTKATKLYEKTKGQRARFGDEKGLKWLSKTRLFSRFWYGGSESFMFNKLEEIANADNPRTPVLHCGIPNSLLPKHCKGDFVTSRVNWVVQSSGADYLHLLLVSMNYLIRRMGIQARFLLSIHDEIRYIVKEEHQYLAAYALQISNLWVRAAFAKSVGIEDLPLNVAFFSSVDIDHCLRKEVDMDCITASNLIPVPRGEGVDVQKLLDKIAEWKQNNGRNTVFLPELSSVTATANHAAASPVLDMLNQSERDPVEMQMGKVQNYYLEAQMAYSDEEVNTIRDCVRRLIGRSAGPNKVVLSKIKKILEAPEAAGSDSKRSKKLRKQVVAPVNGGSISRSQQGANGAENTSAEIQNGDQRKARKSHLQTPEQPRNWEMVTNGPRPKVGSDCFKEGQVVAGFSKRPGLHSLNMDAQQDKLSKEARALRQRVEVLEKENMALKKSLYELSARYNMMAHKVLPFTIDSLEALEPPDALSPSDVGVKTGGPDQQDVFGDVTRDKHKDRRNFHLKHELKAHSGAVYAIQFSPCAKFLASGSFDKTVRVWDATGTQKELHCFKKHNLNVSDLSWSHDSLELLSGAYDQTCKIWDVEAGKLVDSFDSEGFVQCVRFSPQDRNIFFNGTSRNVLSMVDRRKPENALLMRNDSMVNSLYVYQDGMYVISADAAGHLKTWDVRTGKYIQAFVNEPTKKPISHLAVCHIGADEEPRYMAVNSYDNVMRVYDRGFSPPQTTCRLVHALKGYKNKNWPIKSSFYHAKDGTSMKRTTSHDQMYAKDELQADDADKNTFEKDKSLESSILLATGSADPFVYLYSVGGPEGTGELIQRLEGHTDRVYAVDFHPVEPILASCSADFTIKVWYSNGRKKKT